jgi:prolyl 4-hydroxylase
MPKLQLFTVESFLTEEECDKLVEIIGQHHRPSTVLATVDDPYFRTSTTCDLSLLNLPFAEEIDKKIVDFMGISRAYSDGIEGQKYRVGQEFKPHTDYFSAGKPGHEERLKRKGNRTWTFMLYLNNTPKGGGTRFPNAELTFQPQKGKALVWNNLLPDGKPNPFTLHWGMPVEEGEKFVITKWFREYGNGKMLLNA